MLQTALAVGAALVALACSLSVFDRWLARRRRYELAWSVALLLFALGAAALAAGASNGWNGPLFRAFYLFGAIVNVPFLALGTIYLLAGPRAGDRCAGVIGLFAAFATGVVVVAPFTGTVPRHRLPQGSDVFGPLPRVLAAVASGAGVTVVLGGAVWSAWRYRGPGASGGPQQRARLWANVLIAAGTAVTGASGLLNSVLDEMDAFSVTLTIGITLIFAGFVLATAGPGAAPSRLGSGGSRARS